MRHVAEAVPGGTGIVVRVVPDTAKFPLIRIKSGEGNVFTAEADALPYSTALTLDEGANEVMAIYVDDGAIAANRAVEIAVADAEMFGANMLQLVVTETDSAGNDAQIEKFIVSMDPEATDDMGMPAYIETVLESQSKTIRALVSPTCPHTLGAIAKTTFVGGTEGDLSTLTTENYAKAIAVLNASVIGYTNVLGLGCYDVPTIKALIDICNRRRIGGFFDVDPRLSYAAACTAKNDMAIADHRACFYHMPFDCIDPTYRCRAVWGLSGVAFRAKAAGVALTAPYGGYHYTPAGETRAIISRTGLRQLRTAGVPDYQQMYRSRINKLASNRAGFLFIDDSLTACPKENYLRFEQIVSVADSISREFVQLSNALKHEPDGVTYEGLVKGMTTILDGYVSMNALVPPTDPTDGKEPYKLIVEKMDKDAWRIRWAISVTGSGRRFFGEPILLK